MNDKGACTEGFRGNGLGIKGCESGLIYTDALSVGPKTNTYHSTNVFTTNGTWLWEYADLKRSDGSLYNQACFGRGPTMAEFIAHDLAVRDYLTALVGPPANPCLVDNGGCDQVCTDDRGLPKCSCTGKFTCDNCWDGLGLGCVEGYTLQAKGGANAGKCVQRNIRGFVDKCNRTTNSNGAIMTFQGGQLIQRNGTYSEMDFGQPGDGQSGDRCLQASGNLERSGKVEGKPCDAALPSQKWECLDDGSIRQKGTQDVFLKTDMRHCNSTTDPDTCTLEELKWNAFGGDLEGCTFCQATQALCGGGAQRDKDNAARKRTDANDANDANDALPFIATPSGASLLALATLALPLLQGA